MRLLIFGAGVLGTFYAAKLQACGHDVTILARGRRAVQVRDRGLVVQERGRGCLRTRTSVIETLEPDQSYDYVLALVRNDQVESVLPSLAANKATPSLVFMFNNLAGPQRLIDLMGRELFETNQCLFLSLINAYAASLQPPHIGFYLLYFPYWVRG